MLHGFFRISSKLYVSSSDALTRCHCCLIAYDVILRVVSEPASVQPPSFFSGPKDSWLEEDLLSERRKSAA